MCCTAAAAAAAAAECVDEACVRSEAHLETQGETDEWRPGTERRSG